VLDQALGQGALAGAGRAGDADAARAAAPQARVGVRQHALVVVALVLDEADGAGQRRGIAALEALEDGVNRHAP